MTTLGRYQITGTLGEGAMGVVHRAHDPALDREVALKELRLPPGLSAKARTEAIDRFYTEARAAARLSHPSIVTIHEVGEEGGRPFIAMELLDGPTLGEVLEEAGALPPAQAEEVLHQIAEALAHAHAQGVVHRDVKPDNCFWLSDGRVKVADFGIARLEEGTRLTQVGTVMGTPGYMAPEQVKGEEVTASADVFAWGALAYECLTGRPPFGEGDPQAVMYRIVNEDPPDLLALAPDTPAHLAQVIAVSLAKDPGERWGSGTVLRDVLGAEDGSAIQPFLARGNRSRRPIWFGLRRRAWVLLGGVVAAGVGALVFLLVVAGSRSDQTVALPEVSVPSSEETTEDQGVGGDESGPGNPGEPPSAEAAEPITLQGGGVGALPFGSDAREAISLATSLLGQPDHDTGWGSRCYEERGRTILWGALSLNFSHGSLIGWEYGRGLYDEELDQTFAAIESVPLTTDEEIGLGATDGDVREAYPEAEYYPSDESFPPPTYTVFNAGHGSELYLTMDGSGRVTSMSSGGSFCGE